MQQIHMTEGREFNSYQSMKMFVFDAIVSMSLYILCKLIIKKMVAEIIFFI